MKKTFIFIVLSALMLLSSQIAFAGVKQGDKEVALMANMAHSETADSTGATHEETDFLIGGSLGLFLSNASEIGVSCVGTVSENGSTDSDFSVNSFYKYHFNTEADTVPYIGVQLGGRFAEAGSYTAQGFNYGGMAGIKWFLHEKASAFLEYNVAFSEMDWENGNTVTVDSTQQAVLLGLSFYF